MTDLMAALKANLHTVQQRKVYGTWHTTHSNGSLAAFIELYAVDMANTVAEAFDINDRTLAALQVEFGLPEDKAKKRTVHSRLPLQAERGG